MEKNNKQLKSIWGKWWASIRKWFYPAWLVYETFIRFYAYGQSVHDCFTMQQTYVGEIGTQTLAIFFSVITFVICATYLTLPASFLIYHFFQIDNLTNTRLEEKIKKYF